MTGRSQGEFEAGSPGRVESKFVKKASLGRAARHSRARGGGLTLVLRHLGPRVYLSRARSPVPPRRARALCVPARQPNFHDSTHRLQAMALWPMARRGSLSNTKCSYTHTSTHSARHLHSTLLTTAHTCAMHNCKSEKNKKGGLTRPWPCAGRLRRKRRCSCESPPPPAPPRCASGSRSSPPTA